MKTDIDIKESDRESVSSILNALLADEFVLATQTRNSHWNVEGPLFYDLHKLFDSQYAQLDLMLDEIAERVRAIGGRAIGTLAEVLEQARLQEHAGHRGGVRKMTEDLLAAHEKVIRQLRGDLQECSTKHGDAGTADFLTGLLEQHEKMAWMLRALVRGKS